MWRALLLVPLVFVGCAGSDKSTRHGELATGPESPYSFHRSMAYTLLRTGLPGRATDHVERMLRVRPKAAEPHYLKGRVLAALGLHQQARAEVEQAIALEGSFAPAHALHGVLLDSAGEHRKAESSHRRSVELDPRSASYRNNLGFCLYLQKRYGEAVAAYREALQREPRQPKVHNNLAFAHARRGELEAAYKHFRLAGDLPAAHNNMGFVYESRGQLDTAYDLYLTALKADPGLRQARENLARVCQRLGRTMPTIAERIETGDGAPPKEATP